MNWFVFILFFISGACGLIYEVVWSRMMMLIFGRSVLAVGIVLAAFMSGIALGSYVMGKYADRSRNPLRLYALYEIGAGITAFTSSFLLIRITPVYVWVHATFGESPLAFAVVRFFIAFALLLIPTVLMGATLPILSRVVVKQLSRIGKELGSLYAINTVGAVAGSLAAGFYLIGHLGLHGAIDVAVLGNLSVGLLAWLASTRSGLNHAPVPMSSAANPETPIPIADAQVIRTYRLALWAFALSGLASFAYEIFWTRALVFLLGNTTYAFTLMLTAFLAGIALGGYGIRFLGDIVKNPLRLFAAIEILIGVFSAVALPLLFFIVQSEAIRSFIIRYSGQLELLALSNFVMALSLMLLPATLIGATLPLMGQIFVSDLQKTGTTVGKIYAVNTLGNVLGALLPGLLIMPFLGIQKGILLMAALNVGLGIVLVLGRWKHAMAVVSAALVVFLAVTLALVRMPISFKFPSEFQKQRDEVLFYREGGLVTTKVWVSADTGYKVISVDGINIGGTSDSDYKQQILAHLPKLLLKSYSSELSIGLGSGILVGESARHAELRKIVSVEISRGVVEGARYFSEQNFNILNDPRAAIIVDDVVDFLETTQEQYDIISADEKTAGKYATNSFSYSEEYYALLRRKLTPGGLVIQWMPTDLPPSQYNLAVRTFLDEFPHAQLWYFPPVGRFTMTNTFLVGSNDPIGIDAAWMRKTMESDRGSFQGIRKYGLTTAEAVLAHFIGTEETLRRAIPPGPVNTFEEPYYEFYSPSDYAVPPDERTLVNHEMLMSIRGPDFDRFVSKGLSGPDAARLNAAFRAEGIFLDGQVAQLRGFPPQEVVRFYDQAIHASPWDRNLCNEVVAYFNREYLRQYFGGDYNGALAILRRAAEIYPESSDVHQDYGWMLWKMNKTDLAVKELEQALAMNAKVVPVRRILASIYASRGQVEQAMVQWKEALALDRNDIPTLVGYGTFLLNQRPADEALDYLRKAYQLDPEDPDVIDGYARVEYLSGNISAARRIVRKGGDYYKSNPNFEQRRTAILSGN
jgi:spermidine synthase